MSARTYTDVRCDTCKHRTTKPTREGKNYGPCHRCATGTFRPAQPKAKAAA